MTDTLFGAPEPDPVIARQPAGTVIDTEDGPDGLATATFSADRKYRYRLSRVWDPGRGRCCFLMLNPSIADAFIVDPTVRRCINFAREWGYGALEVVNLFAVRSPDPEVLQDANDPVGPDNDQAIVAAVNAASLVVAGWGVHGELFGRAAEVRRLLEGFTDGELHALALTKHGQPRHPLYLKGDLTPMPLA